MVMNRNNGLKIMSPRGAEGRLYRNDGPINPVQDVEAARSMANAEEKTRNRRNMIIDKINDHGDISLLTNGTAMLKSLETPLNEEINNAAERVRSNIAGQSIDRALTLFKLVEIVPVTQNK